MDNKVSEKTPKQNGMRQADSIFSKLFTATIQEVFKSNQPEEKGINIDGEELSDVKFADVTQATDSV